MIWNINYPYEKKCLHLLTFYCEQLNLLSCDLWNKVTFGKVSYEFISLQVLFLIEHTFYKLIPE